MSPVSKSKRMATATIADPKIRVGVSRQSINSIERNRYVPSLPLALTFARVFGCAIDQIFALEDEK